MISSALLWPPIIAGRQYGVWLAAGKFDMLRFKRVRLLVWGVGLITGCVLLALLLSFTATRVAESKGGPTSRSRDALTVADEEGRISYRPRDQSLESQLEQELVHNNAEIFKRAIQRPAHNSTAQKNDDTRKQQKAQAEIYQCLAQKGVTPWLQAMGDSSETYIVFYGKPIMHILWSIVSSRGWKLKHIPKDSSEGLKQLQELISPEHFLIVLTTSLINRGVIRDLANSTNALVGTVGNAFSVTGSKRAQLTSFTNYFQSFGCSLEDTDIMPRSFILDNPTECIQFFRYSNMHPQSWWILKPSGGQGGDGITIHSNLTYFYWHYATCMTQPDAIVQEYITSPLLVKNRKFDIRAYILLARTAPYYLAFYHEGYLRVSMKEFDIHGGRDVHLTNSHVQVSVEGFSKSDHFWSFQDLQDYLDEHRPKDGRDFVLTTLAPFIQKIGVFIVHAAKSVFSRAPSNYLLIGLDFMVTSDLSVRFIEANNYPLWPKGNDFLDDMIEQMGNDMFDLLFDCRHHPEQFQDLKPGQMYGTWTLIWNELYDECSHSLPYNPCKEFLMT